MTRDEWQDLTRLNAALRAADELPPMTSLDWTALEQRIIAAAASRLPRAAPVATWWDVVAQRARLAIPLALAASALFGAIALGTAGQVGALATPATGSAATFNALVGGSEQEIMDAVVQSPREDWLLSDESTHE